MTNFVELSTTLGLAEDDLDELVHRMKGGEAARINNQGIEVQLQYLSSKMTEVELYHVLVGIQEGK